MQSVLICPYRYILYCLYKLIILEFPVNSYHSVLTFQVLQIVFTNTGCIYFTGCTQIYRLYTNLQVCKDLHRQILPGKYSKPLQSCTGLWAFANGPALNFGGLLMW